MTSVRQLPNGFPSSSTVDSIVSNAVRNNKFSSSLVISHITGLPDNLVQESFSRLLESRRIYLSVGGLPKRFSHSSDKNTEDEWE
jgi:hypothetical protein